MIAGHVAAQPGLVHSSGEEPAGDIVAQQPVTVLGERRRVERPVVDRQSKEPLEEQVVVQSFAELAFRTHRVQGHQHRGLQQLLGWHRRPASRRVHGRELVVEPGEHVIQDTADLADRMTLRGQILRVQRRQHRQLAN